MKRRFDYLEEEVNEFRKTAATMARRLLLAKECLIIRIKKQREMENKFEWTDSKVMDILQLSYGKKSCSVDAYQLFIDAFKRTHSFRMSHEQTQQEQERMAQDLHGNLKKKYPSGIISFTNSLSFQEWFKMYGFGLMEECYPKYCEEHFKVGRKINSVENSSHELLTIGDKTNRGTIDGFEIRDREIFIVPNVYSFFSINTHINIVHPFGVFKSEEGIALRHFDVIFLVKEDFKIVTRFHDQGEAESRDVNPQWKRFKFEENANYYVSKNKPLFSTNKIIEILDRFYKDNHIGHSGYTELKKRFKL